MESSTALKEKESPTALKNYVLNRFVAGLERESIEAIQPFHSWAFERIYINDQPLSLTDYQYLEDIYRDESSEIVVEKSAQSGLSEWAIGKAIYFAEIMKENVFYGMPTDHGVGQFVQGRVDPRIDDSPYLRNIVQSTNNIGLKSIGSKFIYFRGSQNRRQIVTVDAGLLICDEKDLMVQSHVPVMEKRLGNSQYKHKISISTPTIPGYGIDRDYLASDQHKWHIPCGSCQKWQTIDFFRSIRPKPTRDHVPEPKEVYSVCKHCGKRIDNLKAGKWIAMNPSSKIRGYHISKLFTKQATLKELWMTYNTTTNIQEFYNSDLGLPYELEGGRLNETNLDACREDKELKLDKITGCTMGVDVGSLLHYRISKMVDGKKRLIEVGTVKNFEDLDIKMKQYDIDLCIIDALPETRKAMEFKQRFSGRVRLAYYNLPDGKEIFKKEPNGIVRINRTRAMENTANGFLTRFNVLKRDSNLVPDYYDQLMAPVKIKVKDEKTGNETYKYVEGNKADHYFHTEVYDDIANLMHKKVEVFFI